jgi:hypothetical protein
MSKTTLLRPLHHDLFAALRDILDTEGDVAFQVTAQRVMEVTAVAVIEEFDRNRLDEMLDDMAFLYAALERRRNRVLN